MSSLLKMVVHTIVDTDAGVRSVTLRGAGGERLAPYPAGSHIGLEWADGRFNSYSLCDFAATPVTYRLAVRLRADGGGGSRWVHGLSEGDVITTTRPKSAFPPAARGRHHILVAGGIGITPVLSHAGWHNATGGSYEAWYVGRDVELCAELEAMTGPRLRRFDSRDRFWAQFGARLRSAPFGTHVYTCGPPKMIDAVAAGARAAGWAPSRIHSETFDAPEPGGRPFVAVARRSGRAIAVGATTALLEALESSGLRVPNMCRRGFCGECVTPVHAGRIDHRDDFLSSTERADGGLMMPCVSRALDDTLELDL